MLSDITRKKLEQQLADLKESMEDIMERVDIARAKGDLKENAEFESAMQDYNNADMKIVELEEKLSSEKAVTTSPNSIGVGTLVDVTYLLATGPKNLGIFMFDGIGSFLNRTISPQSELGRKIQNTQGGKFDIKDSSGNIIQVVIKIVGPSKTQDYLESTPKIGEGFSFVLDK